MRVTWDALTERKYDTGIDQGMLYLDDGSGVPWNGLISVAEGGDPEQESFYFDGTRYFSRSLGSSFSGTITAFTYPDALEPSVGIAGIAGTQLRKPCSISYRTSTEWHIVYNVLLAPSQREYDSLTDQVNPLNLAWDFTTQPVKIPGGRPTSHVVILLDESDPGAISDLELIMYGTNDSDGYDPSDPTTGTPGVDPLLPAIADIVEIFESHTTLRITDNGDGTWTAAGPDNVVSLTGPSSFQINADSAIFIGDGVYRISSF